MGGSVTSFVIGNRHFSHVLSPYIIDDGNAVIIKNAGEDTDIAQTKRQLDAWRQRREPDDVRRGKSRRDRERIEQHADRRCGKQPRDGGAGAYTTNGGQGADVYAMSREYSDEMIQENDATVGNTERVNKASPSVSQR